MDEKKKVYVITSGAYSSYHICAVTMDYEKALDMQKRFWVDNYDGAEIEEFVLDEIDNPRYYISGDGLIPVYRVRIFPDGGLMGIEIWKYADKFKQQNVYNLWPNNLFEAYVLAEDEDHAKKIACDERARLLAERAGL